MIMKARELLDDEIKQLKEECGHACGLDEATQGLDDATLLKVYELFQSEVSRVDSNDEPNALEDIFTA